MFGIYRTAEHRHSWWVESGSGLISHVTAIFALLVSFFSFGRLFTTWDIDWFQHLWQRKEK